MLTVYVFFKDYALYFMLRFVILPSFNLRMGELKIK